MKASKTQVAGNHYKDLAVQPAEYCYRNGLNNIASSIIRYATRAGKKGGREGMEADLRKIVHYAQLWLEYEGFADAPPAAIPDPPATCRLTPADSAFYSDRPGACPSCEDD